MVRLPIFVLDSKIVAETHVVAESVEKMFPSFKCMTGTMRLTLSGKEWHSRSTSTRSKVRKVSP